MAEVPVFSAGGYRYIKAVFQYSGGVAAEPGYEIERARLRRALPLAEGLAAAEAHLKSLGRPAAAFAACAVAGEMAPDQMVVTLLPDTGERYLSAG